MKKYLFFDNAFGQSFHFVKYLPDNYDERKKYPLIVFLHGMGESGPVDGSNLSLVEKVALPKYVNEHGIGDYILVVPQSPDGDELWIKYIESLNRFLDYVLQTTSIDKNRVSLTGLSSGGSATWMWAECNPERFCSILPICGESISWYARRLKDIPVWAFHGDQDNLVLPQTTLAAVTKLHAAGGNGKVNFLKGVGHNAWDYAYNEETINWMLSFKRGN